MRPNPCYKTGPPGLPSLQQQQKRVEDSCPRFLRSHPSLLLTSIFLFTSQAPPVLFCSVLFSAICHLPELDLNSAMGKHQICAVGLILSLILLVGYAASASVSAASTTGTTHAPVASVFQSLLQSFKGLFAPTRAKSLDHSDQGHLPSRSSSSHESVAEEAVANNSSFVNLSAVEKDPDNIAEMVHRSIENGTRRSLGYFSCRTGNPIDDCWRCDPNWHNNRKRLADCAIGFGKQAIGGKNGRFYVVTDPRDDDAVNPRPGTLRHAVIQTEPLWIIFQRDMVIQLKEELIMNSFKTIDGRGVNVHIANGPCITVQYVTNIIIHGIHVHDCKPAGNAMVRDSPTHYGWRTMCDGDGISIFGASHIWVDHCSLSRCADGLIDAIMGSTAITISNNHFAHHNEVMLLGHSDSYTPDVNMQVTIAFNHFGAGLIQRMPRCRHGYFHVVNNDYTHWEMYAIGGSANPTINSQGNRYLAPQNPFAKEVTKREISGQDQWKHWNWRSEGDLLLNGAFFTPSGAGASASYAKASSLAARPSSMVATLTGSAGVLSCRSGVTC